MYVNMKHIAIFLCFDVSENLPTGTLKMDLFYFAQKTRYLFEFVSVFPKPDYFKVYSTLLVLGV